MSHCVWAGFYGSYLPHTYYCGTYTVDYSYIHGPLRGANLRSRGVSRPVLWDWDWDWDEDCVLIFSVPQSWSGRLGIRGVVIG